MTIKQNTLGACAAIATALVAVVTVSGLAHATAAPAPELANAQKRLASLSVPFVPNAGQWDARTAFAARTFAGTLLVTTEGKLVYSLPAALLTESFVNRSGQPLTATPHGFRPAEAKVSHFSGNDTSKHRSNLNAYDRVNMGEVFPGVNVQLRATNAVAGGNVEKIFTVAANQDTAQIRVRLDGASALAIGDRGELIASTDAGPVTYTAPIAFQTLADGSQRDIPVSYALNAASQTYGFTLGNYDHALPLVIDPLLKSIYLGSSGSERANAIAVHPHSGEVYVTGYTGGAGAFNSVSAAISSTFGALPASNDVFVARLSADLSRVIHVTFFGGSGDDQGLAIAIHPASGDVYVAGRTSSSNFPTGSVAGAPAQLAYGGGIDAFLSRLSADLTTLKRSTYYGNSNLQSAVAIAIHPVTGEIYMGGHTQGAAPTDPGVAQPAYGGAHYNGFVSRHSADLGTRLAATHLGGSIGNGDEISAMAIHPQTGDIYVAGDTWSPDFPGVTASSAQPSRNGNSDWFVARLNRTLTANLGATYLGGPDSNEYANALAIHPVSGEIIVAGYTSAITAGTPFPGLAGAPQATSTGGNDAAIVRLNPQLTSVLQSTLLGGAGYDFANAVAVHPQSGEIWVSGYSDSSAFATPASSDALQPAGNSPNEIIVARYRADLKVRLGATFLGGAGNDSAAAMAIHPGSGEVLVAGISNAVSFPGTTAGSPTSYAGGFDAIVIRLSSDLTLPNRIPATLSFIAQSNVPAGSLRTSNEARMEITPPPGSNQSVYVSGPPGSQMCVTNTPGCCLLADPSAMCSASGGFATGWFAGPWDSLSGDYIAVRHNAATPSGTTVTNVITAGVAFPFVTSTGNALMRCNLDANGDNNFVATVEGLILIRAMLGLGADAIIAGTGVAAWEPYRQQLNANCGTTFPFSASAFS